MFKKLPFDATAFLTLADPERLREMSSECQVEQLYR